MKCPPFSIVAIAFSIQLIGCGPSDSIKYKDTVVGTGETATLGKTVSVIYTGKLNNGITFDSNVGGKLLTFTIGKGQVIKGWDQGLIGMKVGGERDLDVPASLAYGNQSPGELIPPNSDLHFHIKLASVQ